jgi:RES domain-containing protein
MRAYRIYRRARREVAFTGEGARIVGARWNLPGTAVVYTSSTLALSFLEFLIHFDPESVDIAQLRLEYRFAEIPDELSVLEVCQSGLPADWNAIPWSTRTQKLGSKWMEDARHAVISVPCVVIPSERNYLLNPLHADFSKVLLGPPCPFTIDPRLFTTLRSRS